MLTADRATVLVSATRPVARTVSWSIAGGTIALGWTPLIVTMARGGTDLTSAYVFAAIVASSIAALAADDDAIELASSLPVPLAQRRTIRLLELVIASAAAAAVAVAVGTGRDPRLAGTLGDRAAEAVAVGAVALAIASVVADRRYPSAGPIGAAAASLGVIVVATMASRFSWLPGIQHGQHHAWWWIVAAVATTATAWTWRDPASRSRRGTAGAADRQA